MIILGQVQSAHGYDIRMVLDEEDVGNTPYRLQWQLTGDGDEWVTNADVCHRLVGRTWSAFLAKALA